MAMQNTNFDAGNLKGMFNLQGYQNILKTWASMNERMTSIFVEAGTRSVDIMSEKTKEALSNLREVTQVRDEPAEYTQAYSDFAQKQVDLLKSVAEEVGKVTQQVGTETKELASEAGQELNDKITANVKGAADKVASNVENVADKASTAAEKSASVAKKNA